jgi:hypothetical protein
MSVSDNSLWSQILREAGGKTNHHPSGEADAVLGGDVSLRLHGARDSIWPASVLATRCFSHTARREQRATHCYGD